MIFAKLLSGLVARATFCRRVTARVRRLVQMRGSEGFREMVLRPKGGVPAKPHGVGGPDNRRTHGASVGELEPVLQERGCGGRRAGRQARLHENQGRRC